MRLPTITVKRWLVAIAAIAGALALRQFAGEHCRHQAFYYEAEANSAMMDVAGFNSEAKHAFKKGDQERYKRLTRQLADARSREALYSGRSRRYETVAWLLGMAPGPDYLPPEWPPE